MFQILFNSMPLSIEDAIFINYFMKGVWMMVVLNGFWIFLLILSVFQV